ncbi:hypothetical protein Ga0100231_020295 [Opitutaceae bacterium TAV4]|nr:hypothetical protein Ga0100231_020295 [Opitutaceae bacterium TAV4]RRK00394.1 hypothetical protein Ga0100230_021100 [Opitutaceae bacterium TAV3]
MTTRPLTSTDTAAAAAEHITLSQRTGIGLGIGIKIDNKTTPSGATTDQLMTTHAIRLRAALDDVPEIRPEVLARAHALATDPNWPGATQIEHIARLLTESPDLTEDTR